MEAMNLSEGIVGERLETIFAEWLKGWFDGRTHRMGEGLGILFPLCLVRFGQGAGDGLGTEAGTTIRLVVLPRREEDWQVEGGKVVESSVVLNFWVDSRVPGKGRSRYEARRVAGLLSGLLRNPAMKVELGARGVTRVEPKGPVELPSKDWAEWLVASEAVLTWELGLEGPVVGGGGMELVLFEMDRVLEPDGYLAGEYLWPQGRWVKSVRWSARAPAVDQVLELEADGVLTGIRLTLACDAELSRVRGVMEVGRWVSGRLRWRSVAGSDNAAQCAGLVSVEMESERNLADGNQWLFDMEGVLVIGGYLSGELVWPQGHVVGRVNWRAQAPVSDQVLELEADGVLTGIRVTLAGAVGGEVSGELEVGRRVSGRVRWKCVEGEGAWMVGVVMEG